MQKVPLIYLTFEESKTLARRRTGPSLKTIAAANESPTENPKKSNRHRSLKFQT